MNYAGRDQRQFTFTTGFTYYDYPRADDIDGYPEFYVGFNVGNFSFKQWYSDDFYALGDNARCTPRPTTP